MRRPCDGARAPFWGPRQVQEYGWVASMLVLLALPCLAQTGKSRAQGKTHGRAYSQVSDPHAGTRWLIFRDPVNPAGPGRAVLVADAEEPETGKGAEVKVAEPVIHPGDKITLEEHTAVVEAYLEGLARGAATVGACLEVRLKIGGKIVPALAIAPGRAALADGSQCRKGRR